METEERVIGFRQLVQDFPNAQGFCISQDEIEFEEHDIRFINWKTFLKELFKEEK